MDNPLFLRFRDSRGDQQEKILECEMSLGRTDASDIRIDDETISRKHAQIVWEDGTPVIIDTGSRNGIHLGEERVERMALRDGLAFRLGGVSIFVENPLTGPQSIHVNQELPQQGVLDSLMIDDWQSSLDKKDVKSTTTEQLGVALKLFKDAAETLLTGSDLQEVAEGAIELALRSLPVDRGFVSLLDEEGELQSVAEKSREGLVDQDSMKLSSTIARQVIDERIAVLIRDTGNMDGLSASHSIVQMSIQSALCAPLTSGEKVLGIIYVVRQPSR